MAGKTAQDRNAILHMEVEMRNQNNIAIGEGAAEVRWPRARQ